MRQEEAIQISQRPG